MWILIISVVIFGLMIYLTCATAYLLFLAAAYFLVKEPEHAEPKTRNKFAILIPAHNEELLIARLFDSLLGIDYPKASYQVYVVADNCTDQTASIAGTFPFNVLIRKDEAHIGKGYAIDWAITQIPLNDYDALLIVDADNIVDKNILLELNKIIDQGFEAIQCHNSVGNREDSWFTQLLFVSRTIGNLLYHHAKYKLGLSSYLMGNGICFSTKLLMRKKWTAFSLGEDWEYYAQLIHDRVKIGFAVKAKVFHQESRSLEQATTQRLRWSSGRFHVLRRYGFGLLKDGIRRLDWFTVDASLPLVFPNYSLQFNLTILYLTLSVLITKSYFRPFFMIVGVCLVIGQIALFAAGMYLAKSYREVLKALFRAPFFLVWKAFIDIFSVTGLYQGKKWVRTSRHLSKDNNINDHGNA